jgi:hypothetical protein
VKQMFTVLLTASLVMARVGGVGAGEAVQTVLLKALLRLEVVEQVRRQAAMLAQKAPEADAKAVEAAADDWVEKRKNATRRELTDTFGEGAKSAFQAFVAQLSERESANDRDYLALLAGALGLASVPDSYVDLRVQAIERLLSSDMQEGADFLAEIETWLDVAVQAEAPPSLEAWLSRAGTQESIARDWSFGATKSMRPPRASDALRMAEAEVRTGTVPEGLDSESQLDRFSDSRKARRARKLAEAEAGMAQVAAERRAAEEAYAKEQLAKAQAEADAMRSQAEKMAAAEQEALAQRQNSFGNRLKRVVGATVSAAGGAFFGGVGARAGQEAVNAIFGD